MPHWYPDAISGNGSGSKYLIFVCETAAIRLSVRNVTPSHAHFAKPVCRVRISADMALSAIHFWIIATHLYFPSLYDLQQ